MGRVLAIDYGTKRTGIAVTDPERLIATPLETVPTNKIMDFLKEYAGRETVDVIVVGIPSDDKGHSTDATQPVQQFMNRLKNNFTQTEITGIDEAYTSVMARDAMIRGGTRKKYREKKENIDRISATIILQSYLEQSNI